MSELLASPTESAIQIASAEPAPAQDLNRNGTAASRVLLVEDHRMFREWLGQMLGQDEGFVVCGETDNVKQAFALVQQTKPDVAVVDITLNGSSGLEFIKDLKAQEINVPVLVLSMHDESLYAERALRAGAKGYITKHEAASTLREAIRCVISGRVYLSEAMTANIVGRVCGKGPAKAGGGLEALADRELEVFHLIGKGLNTREIAARLHLGESTVETYRSRIKEKLNIRNAAELYSKAAHWIEKSNNPS